MGNLLLILTGMTESGLMLNVSMVTLFGTPSFPLPGIRTIPIKGGSFPDLVGIGYLVSMVGASSLSTPMAGW